MNLKKNITNKKGAFQKSLLTLGPTKSSQAFGIFKTAVGIIERVPPVSYIKPKNMPKLLLISGS